MNTGRFDTPFHCDLRLDRIFLWQAFRDGHDFMRFQIIVFSPVGQSERLLNSGIRETHKIMTVPVDYRSSQW